MTKKRNLQFVYLVVILAGIGLMIFPFARERYEDWKQARLLAGLEIGNGSASAAEATQRLREEYARLSALFEEEAPLQNEDAGASAASNAGENVPENASQPAAPLAQKQERPQAIAVLSIDKINLKLPVLEGATQENMRYAAVHMTETAPLGEIGNAAIAAHRARTKGRLFNRLDELEIGDVINVDLPDGKIQYTVHEIKRVKPEDISVLGSNGKDAVLTLITCDPLVNPTHRLIVQAKMNGSV